MHEFLFYFMLLLGVESLQHDPEKTFMDKQEVDSLAAVMQIKTVELITNSQFGKAHQYLDSINSKFSKNKNTVALYSQYYRMKGLVYIHSGKHESAHHALTHAIKKAYSIDSSNKYLPAALSQMCNLWMISRNWDSALVYGLQAYYISQKNGGSQLPTICLFLHSIYSQTRDSKNSKKYLFEGLKYSRGKPEEVNYLNDVGSYYQQNNQLDSALYYMEAFYNSKTAPSPYIEAAKHLNYGGILTMNGELTKGLYHLKKGIAVRRTISIPDEFAYSSLALAYHQLSNSSAADLYYDTAINVARSKGNYYQIAALYCRRSELDRKRNKLNHAYKWMDSALQYYVKFDSASLSEKTNEIEAKYSVKDKIDSIGKLSYQNSLNSTIKRQQSIIIGSLSIGFLLLIGFGTTQYKKLKLKANVREFQLHQSALRSKMQPHFVFNSLSILQSLINFNEKEKAIRLLQVFSQYARITFEIGGNNLVLLKDEVNALESYLFLLSENYSTKFTYSICAYENYKVERILIMPMLIQPFVENAIIHGLEKLDYLGHISISFKKETNFIVCLIEDNGIGPDKFFQKVKKKRTSSSITQDRLSLQGKKTGLKGGFTIIDRKETDQLQGTRVEIKIPFECN